MSAHRIGMVGCGAWGRNILRDLKSLGCEVYVAEHSESNRNRALELGADRVYASMRELPTVEGFVVVTQTSLHATTLEELIPLGRPIFVEKPLTSDVRAARRLVELAGDRIFVMDKWRYHPGVERLRDIARSGELGPIEALRTCRFGWANPHPDVDMAWILLPHDLAIVLEILGHIPNPVAAFAEHSSSGPTGLVGVLGTAPSVIVEVSAKRPVNLRSVCVNFRDGSATLEDSYSPHIQLRRTREGVARADDLAETLSISGELPLKRELQAFLGYLDGGPPPRSTSRDALRNVEVLAQLRELAKFDG